MWEFLTSPSMLGPTVFFVGGCLFAISLAVKEYGFTKRKNSN